VQQLGDDRRHAQEMAGPALPFENRAQRSDVDRGGEPRRVDSLRRGRVEQVDALPLEQLRVALEIPRIALEVFAGAELHGVDEDRGHDGRILVFGALDERKVPGVQRTHGRDEADGPAQRASDGPGRTRGADDLHDPRPG
jgi:hypothetical protein